MRIVMEISNYKAIVTPFFLKHNYKDIYILPYDYKGFPNYIHSRCSDDHITY